MHHCINRYGHAQWILVTSLRVTTLSCASWEVAKQHIDNRQHAGNE